MIAVKSGQHLPFRTAISKKERGAERESNPLALKA